jgi:hypothetical protein
MNIKMNIHMNNNRLINNNKQKMNNNSLNRIRNTI